MNSETIKTRAKEIGDMPAFPCTSDQFAFGDRGMNLRQWLVGMALQGITSGYMQAEGWNAGDFAEQSIRIADATLTALAESEARNG